MVVLASACGPGSRDHGDDADAAPDATPSPPTFHYGQVVISEQHQTGQSLANFAVVLPQDQIFGGSSATADGCDYFPNPQFNVSAGPIQVTGALVAVSATPDTNTPPVHYSVVGNGPHDMFTPDATLGIQAAGEPTGVAAFSGTVRAPGPIVGASLPGHLNRSEPATMTWAAGDGDEMWVQVYVEVGVQQFASIWCRRVPDSGSYTISPAALALLPITAGSASTYLWRVNITTVVAGDFPVELTAADSQSTPFVPFNL